MFIRLATGFTPPPSTQTKKIKEMKFCNFKILSKSNLWTHSFFQKWTIPDLFWFNFVFSNKHFNFYNNKNVFIFVLLKHKFYRINCRCQRDSNSELKQASMLTNWPQPRSDERCFLMLTFALKNQVNVGQKKVDTSVTSNKSLSIYKSCPKIISLEIWKISTTL